MNEYQKIACAMLITFLFIVLMFVGFDNRVNEYEDFMGGLWKADEDFCEESGVDSMMMFIGDNDKGYFNSSRQCHILINDGYSNQGFTMNYKHGSVVGIPTTHHNYTIIPQLEFEEEEIMPSGVVFELSMRNNMLKIYDDDQLYGIFYKDHETTDKVGSAQLEFN